jgi:hypothetical protein
VHVLLDHNIKAIKTIVNKIFVQRTNILFIFFGSYVSGCGMLSIIKWIWIFTRTKLFDMFWRGTAKNP